MLQWKPIKINYEGPTKSALVIGCSYLDLLTTYTYAAIVNQIILRKWFVLKMHEFIFLSFYQVMVKNWYVLKMQELVPNEFLWYNAGGNSASVTSVSDDCSRSCCNNAVWGFLMMYLHTCIDLNPMTFTMTSCTKVCVCT